VKDDLRYPLLLAAMEIAQEAPEQRQRVLAEAIALLVGEVDAAARNMADFPRVAAAMFEQLANPKPRLYAVDEEAS
jgi:hypothetical protein